MNHWVVPEKLRIKDYIVANAELLENRLNYINK